MIVNLNLLKIFSVKSTIISCALIFERLHLGHSSPKFATILYPLFTLIPLKKLVIKLAQDRDLNVIAFVEYK